ncbi:protein FAR1-RELATED SEQUENCE 5-like [Silene latifolia]|uniref:protein FAR1-RELATED SEQUENCE 5-like n=1 Tax=Silene latifolia TaxID=37657 RepID=UPI003D77D488
MRAISYSLQGIMMVLLLILHNYHIIPIISFIQVFLLKISAYSIIIAMSDPTSNVTSSSCNDLHVSAITSKDSNDIVESSIASTVLIEPPDASSSTPHVEQHFVPSRVHQLLLDSTPGGSELWTRNVAPEFKPYIGQLFGTLEELLVFMMCMQKHVVLNLGSLLKKGFRDRKRKATVLDSGKEQATPRPFDIRNTKLTRIGCTAMIEFHYNEDGYVVFQFRECRNHRLCSLRNQQFQKKHRHLHLYHKQTIIDHSRVNQGPTRAFRNVKEYVDGYENVGAQLVDFKNFGRDIKCFIGDRDAQLFVNYFEDKRDTTEGFYFAYEVDSGKCLVRAFWCDAESRRNYALLVITSLTIQLTDEDSFTWVFQKFLDAMGQREPHCIITDQCAGKKLGLRAVFKHAKRRYCMWHIMQKLTDKKSGVSWSMSITLKVIPGCQPCLEKGENGSQLIFVMFLWVVYYEQLNVRESNNFFKRFENAHDFQVEASASICSLSVGGFTPPANGVELIGIADARTQKTYQVVYNSLTNDAECSCKLFNGKGIISRHIIRVYSENKYTLCPINTFLCGGPRMHIRSLFMVHMVS